MPKIVVLTLGGTIGMVPAEGGGLRPALSGSVLLAALGGIEASADLQVIDLLNRPSPHLSFEDLCLAAQRTAACIAEGATGVVVVQGTDCIEITAFVLDVLLGGETCVVVTGAMRGARAPGADGPANLAAAVQVAASQSCRALGVVVVMNDEIHAARYVTKRHSSNPGAFVSDPGPIGRVIEGRPRVLLRPQAVTLPALPLNNAASRPLRVPHISAEIDDDGALVQAALGIGCDGLVIGGMGGGHVAPSMVPALTEAAKRMPVILASRCPDGGVLSDTYGYTGGEIDLAARGLIRAGFLPPSKARAALILLLRANQPAPAIRAFFTAYGGG